MQALPALPADWNPREICPNGFWYRRRISANGNNKFDVTRANMSGAVVRKHGPSLLYSERDLR